MKLARSIATGLYLNGKAFEETNPFKALVLPEYITIHRASLTYGGNIELIELTSALEHFKRKLIRTADLLTSKNTWYRTEPPRVNSRQTITYTFSGWKIFQNKRFWQDSSTVTFVLTHPELGAYHSACRTLRDAKNEIHSKLVKRLENPTLEFLLNPSKL